MSADTCALSGLWVADPVSERVSDLAGGVLLEEVDAGDGDLALAGPGSAEFSLCAGQAGPGSALMNSLGMVFAVIQLP